MIPVQNGAFWHAGQPCEGRCINRTDLRVHRVWQAKRRQAATAEAAGPILTRSASIPRHVTISTASGPASPIQLGAQGVDRQSLSQRRMVQGCGRAATPAKDRALAPSIRMIHEFQGFLHRPFHGAARIDGAELKRRLPAILSFAVDISDRVHQ
jgi:hypothetical protein